MVDQEQKSIVIRKQTLIVKNEAEIDKIYKREKKVTNKNIKQVFRQLEKEPLER